MTNSDPTINPNDRYWQITQEVCAALNTTSENSLNPKMCYRYFQRNHLFFQTQIRPTKKNLQEFVFVIYVLECHRQGIMVNIQRLMRGFPISPKAYLRQKRRLKDHTTEIRIDPAATMLILLRRIKNHFALPAGFVASATSIHRAHFRRLPGSLASMAAMATQIVLRRSNIENPPALSTICTFLRISCSGAYERLKKMKLSIEPNDVPPSIPEKKITAEITLAT